MLTPSNLLAYPAILRILCVFEKEGVLDALQEHQTEGISIETLARKLSLKSDILEPLCEFLAVNAPEVLVKNNDAYFLTRTFLEPAWQNNLYFALAYEPVFAVLSDLLRGDAIYGEDVVRDGAYLYTSSAIHNSPAWDVVIEHLRGNMASVVIDCGCSGGDFLFRVCNELPNVRCIGVDTDEAVIADARESARSSGLENRLTFVVGDASDPKAWKKAIPENVNNSDIAFTGITIWHEFLYHGEQHLLDIFARYRSYFPGSTFVIVEYNGFAWNDLTKLPESLREAASVYMLVHPLTMQGIPRPKERWTELLKRAGVSLQSTSSMEPNSTLYISTL